MSGESSNRELAENLKGKANEHFKNKEYAASIDLYTQAIEADGTVAAYYSNRSFAYIRTEMFGAALIDANEAIAIEPSFVKAYYRRATANMLLGKWKLALRDFEQVSKVAPKDRDAQEKFKQCKSMVHQLAFQKAISTPDSDDSVLTQLDLKNMSIEADYSGPTLRGSPDSEFCDTLVTTFRKQGKVHKRYAYEILSQMKDFLAQQKSMVRISVPAGQKFTICGDIHGQFYDLCNIFDLNGLPSETNPYLFNGDFVDRGSFSVECVLTLFAFKLLYPQHLFLARGNHESRTMNQMYGFEGEVKAKFTPQMVELFSEVFNLLPLAHLINDSILVVHGGLCQQDGVTLEDIENTDRDRQPPDSGIMCDLLWSDPQPQPGRSASKRGVGCQFGPDITANFCDSNGLKYVVRSHEVKEKGYEVSHDGRCITVFSAPNYCDQMGNQGAFVTITGDDLSPNFTSFNAVPHPNVRPMAYANSFLSNMGIL